MDLAQNAEKLPNIIPCRQRSERRVLVVTAVTAERDAVLRGLHGDARFEVLMAGVGSVVAAVNTAKVLAAAEYSWVISAGIGGGFPGRVEVGSVVMANEIVVADLGADTPEGFRSVDELGFGFTQIQTDASLVDRVTKALLVAQIPFRIGPVLTVSTVTGTAAKALEMVARIPGATAEAMEGFGVGFAALESGLPVLEMRAISNMVGPRERSKWRIKEALNVLETACAALTEVIL